MSEGERRPLTDKERLEAIDEMEVVLAGLKAGLEFGYELTPKGVRTYGPDEEDPDPDESGGG